MPPIWRRQSARHTGLISLALVLLCAAAYGGVLENGFLSHDDSDFVTENPHVRAGVTLEGVRWHVLHGTASNWVPLSFISHAIDVSLFGLDAGRHHLTNLLLHAGNTVLLFLLLAAYTGATWRSFSVATLFAVHPLHVESVAWIAERRDVLSAFFFFLTLAAYRRYVRRPGTGIYAVICLIYVLGLLAKPMLVTLPVLLLLLDFWPLRRIGPGAPTASPRPPAAGMRRALLEKLPLAAIALADGVITIVVQSRDGAVSTLGGLPLGQRLANAVVATAVYLRKMLWPVDLAIFYPHPGGGLQASTVILAGLLLLAISVGALALRRRMPFVLTGWLWYLAMLVPVVGILQVGKQAMADRYTYLPLVGMYIGLCWSLGFVWKRLGRARVLAGAGGLALVAILVTITHRQVGTWRNDRSVFEHAARVTERNALAAMKLGDLSLREGNAQAAVGLLREAALYDPRDDKIHVLLGVAHGELGQSDAAVRALREALRLNPDNSEALNNLGELLTALGRPSEALAFLERGVAVDPARPELHYNRGNALGTLGRRQEAIAAYLNALRLRPGYGSAHNNLGTEYQALGLGREAEAAYLAAIASEPGMAGPRYNLGFLYLGRGDQTQALAQYRALVAIDRGAAEALGRFVGMNP